MHVLWYKYRKRIANTYHLMDILTSLHHCVHRLFIHAFILTDYYVSFYVKHDDVLVGFNGINRDLCADLGNAGSINYALNAVRIDHNRGIVRDNVLALFYEASRFRSRFRLADFGLRAARVPKCVFGVLQRVVNNDNRAPALHLDYLAGHAAPHLAASDNRHLQVLSLRLKCRKLLCNTKHFSSSLSVINWLFIYLCSYLR